MAAVGETSAESFEGSVIRTFYIPPDKRHGVVIPGVGTPPDPPCGGPAWCEMCNAEMIELEGVAVRYAYQNLVCRGDPDIKERFNYRWARADGIEKYPRRMARQRIKVSLLTDRAPRKPKASPAKDAAKALGLTQKEYLRKIMAEFGMTAREYHRRIAAAK